MAKGDPTNKQQCEKAQSVQLEKEEEGWIWRIAIHSKLFLMRKVRFHTTTNQVSEKHSRDTQTYYCKSAYITYIKLYQNI